MVREIVFKTEADMPPMPMSIGTTLVNKTGSWRYVRPVYVNRTAPCNHSCPAGEDIVVQLDLMRQGKYREAWELLVRENPFPGICGRVCPHPCESECNRTELGGAIAIHAQERFLADRAAGEGWLLPRPEPSRDGKVAIIGGGPAGLSCAYQLTLRGYQTVVFDAGAAPGGMMRLIPEYRLPAGVLEGEIDALAQLGIEIRTSSRLGENLSHSELDGYDAVFIAIGQSLSRDLGIPGEDASGVIRGIHFLDRLRRGEQVEIGPRVAVIGGGNTAVDAARSARRLGSQVFILYRRGREEMPAIEEEIVEAWEEGVAISYLTVPIAVLTEGGRVKGLRCVRTTLGEPDESGRRRPVPVADSEYDFEVDTVILALGQNAELEFLAGKVGTERGRIVIDQAARTSTAGVFSGGDVATGAGTVAAAVGSGKRAAIAIDLYLQGKSLEDLPSLSEAVHVLQRDRDDTVVGFSDLNLDYFEVEERSEERHVAPAVRVATFRETNLGYSEEVALREAERCLSCGTCNRCDTCLIFCPDVAIWRSTNNNKMYYEVNYDYCKGCGICAEECPRRAICIEEEAQWKK